SERPPITTASPVPGSPLPVLEIGQPHGRILSSRLSGLWTAEVGLGCQPPTPAFRFRNNRTFAANPNCSIFLARSSSAPLASRNSQLSGGWPELPDCSRALGMIV